MWRTITIVIFVVMITFFFPPPNEPPARASATANAITLLFVATLVLLMLTEFELEDKKRQLKTLSESQADLLSKWLIENELREFLLGYDLLDQSVIDRLMTALANEVKKTWDEEIAEQIKKSRGEEAILGVAEAHKLSATERFGRCRDTVRALGFSAQEYVHGYLPDELHA
ncbi:MAG TPA: hypothetical protein VJJ22_03975 [Candidatus Paceibacterota bacterium]